jgi:Na+-translocating ferredoxin:NAD+ oxidoreductase subunit C
MEQRTLEEVKNLSAEQAVEIIRQAGIVGAGGGGFPTYFKYESPQPNLIVNCTESETGYWADKLVHREYFEEFLELYEAMKAIFGIERVIMGVHFKDEEWFSEYKENANGLYEVSLVPDKYSMGEEKTLLKNIFYEEKEKWVPRRVEMPDGSKRPGLPPDAGHIVNNSETLLNVYNALFLGKPVTTKFFSVFGEGVDRLKVYEVPVGASATEILEMAGVNVHNSGPLDDRRWSLLTRDGHRGARYERCLRAPDDQRVLAHLEGLGGQGVRRGRDRTPRRRHSLARR